MMVAAARGRSTTPATTKSSDHNMAEQSPVFPHVPAASACSDDAADELSVKDIAKVLKELEKIIDWYSLGTYLEVEAHILDAIEEENPTIKRRMIKMLQHWLRTGRGCSWRKLVEALYQMGELAVTDNIRRKHLSLTTPVLPKFLQDHNSYTASLELRASIEKKNKHRIASKFSFLVTQLRKRFEVLNVDPADLRTFLAVYGQAMSCKDFSAQITHLDTLALLFDLITQHGIWDYWNFDLAGSLVEHFTQKDQICLDLLADYQRDITGYLITTEIVHYIAAKREAGPTATPPENIPSEELCSKLTVKLAIDVTTHSLKYVEEVWKTLLRRSQLPKHTLLLWDIAESSLMITWLFPKSKAAELADAILGNMQELRMKRVFSVTINEFELLQMDIEVSSADDELDINEAGVGEELVGAAGRGNVGLVASLLQEGAGVNSSKDERGHTPLVAGCGSGSTELVKLLIEHGADFNMRADLTPSGVLTPLGTALQLGHEEVAALLIEHGADLNALGVQGKVGGDTVSATPLLLAATKGLQRSIKLLLERGADANTKCENEFTPLGTALAQYHEEVAALLIEHGADVNALGLEKKVGGDTVSSTPLQLAAMAGFSKLVKLLIEHGADVNTKCESKGKIFTPLGTALGHCHEEVSALLMEHGADVNALGLEINVGEVNDTFTPLMLAAQRGLQRSTKLLLERGADVNAKSESSGNTATPLGTALNNGNEEVAALLIEHGADLNAVGLEGKVGEVTVSATPLMLATMKGLQCSIKLLLERGADVDTKCEKSGYTVTPLGMALDLDEEVAALLIEHGADVNAVATDLKMGEVTGSLTPLMLAAAKGLQHSTQLLLERGAELDKETETCGLLQCNSISMTALMYASSAEVAKLLLEYGAQVDFQGSHGGFTALMVASNEGHYEVTEFLLERGAQVDLQNSEGKTALMHAVSIVDPNNDKDAVGLARLLLQHGANPQLEDREGKTALALAVEQWDTELIELLSDPAKASTPRDTPRLRAEHKKEPRTAFGMIKGLFSNLVRRS